MIQSESIESLAKALVEFQSKQKPIAPNATNPFLKNKYADLPALVDGTKANLKACKLAVSQLLNGKGVTTVLMHETGQYIGTTAQIEPTESKGLNNAQTMGVAISYTRRYAYASILGLVTDEDTDGATSKDSYEKTKSSSNGKISEAQRKRLFAIGKENLVTEKAVKSIIAKFGYESTSDINKTDYDEICKAVENYSGEQDDLPFDDF